MIAHAYIDNVQVHDTADLSLVSFRIGTPAPRAVVANRPLAHGAFDSTRYYGPRSYELQGELWGQSMADFWRSYDKLTGVLALRPKLRTLRFRREGRDFDEWSYVRVDSDVDIPLEAAAPFARWGVSLLAPDPRIYEWDSYQQDIDPLAEPVAQGVKMPLEFPLHFGAGIIYPTVRVGGNFDTPPTFTIYGPATNPVIRNVTDDVRITVQGTVDEGEALVIDVASRSCVLDGTPRPDMIDAAETTWFSLWPGDNLVRLTGDNFAAGKTKLRVEFHNARIA